MPYVIFTANGEEYDRRELTRPMVLGRAPDCDITIPDITLSRRHCRLEPSDDSGIGVPSAVALVKGLKIAADPLHVHVQREHRLEAAMDPRLQRGAQAAVGGPTPRCSSARGTGSPGPTPIPTRARARTSGKTRPRSRRSSYAPRAG